jgi:hypothetical protein
MTTVVEKKFETIGARIKIVEPRRNDFSIDVKRDSEGEYFELRVAERIDMMVLDAQKSDRHLLLMTKAPVLNRKGDKIDEVKSKFLCGHDERHWFTCAIPESSRVTTVIGAKQALKPKELVDIETKEGVSKKNAHKRHRLLKSGKKIHRQGEFMFVPEPSFEPPKGNLTKIWKNEPMRGGGSHFHYAEFLYRVGGRQVYVVGSQVLEAKDYQKLLKQQPELAKRYRSMMADPTVYVKGKISHEEHATVNLGSVWHKVLVNTENKARARANVKFVD